MVPHEIVTMFQVPNDRIQAAHGIGMVQADPRNESAHEAMFMHCNIIKWSMRQFLCEGCADIWSSRPGEKFISRYEDSQDDIYQNLRQGKRIFESDALADQGLDPEPQIWKSVMHTACRSKAWGNEQVCRAAKEYMTKTFGFEFKPTKVGEATGHTDDLCLVSPQYASVAPSPQPTAQA